MLNWSTSMILAVINSVDTDKNTYEAVAEKLSKTYGGVFSAEQVRSVYRRYKARKELLQVRNQFTPVPQAVSLTNHSQGIAVASDFHAPFYSPVMVERMLSLSRMMGVDTLCIAGDLLDFSTLSHYPVVSEAPSVQEEFEAVRVLFRQFFTQYDRIFYISGNHDERFSKRLQSDVRMRDIAAMLFAGEEYADRVITTEYDYVDVSFASGIRWRLGHASSYSRQPGLVASRVAHAIQRNVAVGHDHLHGFMSTVDGKHVGVSLGCMIDLGIDNVSPMWYKERRLSDRPPFANGFMILSNDGHPSLYHGDGASIITDSVSWSQLESMFD